MAHINGVNVTGTLVPTNDTDVFPVTDPFYGIDGQRTVPTLADRDAIPIERRREGMWVYTQAEGTGTLATYWRLGPEPWLLTAADWTQAYQIPDPTGQDGSFLTTDGSIISWGALAVSQNLINSLITALQPDFVLTNPPTPYINPTWLGSILGSIVSGNISGNANGLTANAHITEDQVYDNFGNTLTVVLAAKADNSDTVHLDNPGGIPEVITGAKTFLQPINCPSITGTAAGITGTITVYEYQVVGAAGPPTTLIDDLASKADVSTSGANPAVLLNGNYANPGWLTSVEAAILASDNGPVPLACLGTGTPSNTTFLRGDNTWAQPSYTFSMLFDSSYVVNSVLPVNHNLSSQYNIVTIVDDSNTQVEPGAITFTDANNLSINFGHLTVTNTWLVIVVPTYATVTIPPPVPLLINGDFGDGDTGWTLTSGTVITSNSLGFNEIPPATSTVSQVITAAVPGSIYTLTFQWESTSHTFAAGDLWVSWNGTTVAEYDGPSTGPTYGNPVSGIASISLTLPPAVGNDVLLFTGNHSTLMSVALN